MASLPIVDTVQDAAGRLLAQSWERTSLAVDTAADTIEPEIPLKGRIERVALEIRNDDGVHALNDVVIQAQASPNADWLDYITAAQLNTGTAVANLLDLVVTNPTTLAAGGKSLVVFVTRGLYKVRVKLKMATAAGLASLFATGTVAA